MSFACTLVLFVFMSECVLKLVATCSWLVEVIMLCIGIYMYMYVKL